MLVLAAVAILPGMVQFVRAEAARWNLARCYEAELRGNVDRAEAFVNSALRWNPGDEQARYYRVSMLLREGRAAEVVQDAEQLLADARARHDNAPTPGTRGSLAVALNLSAYVSGLSNVNLDQALERVDEALQLLGGPNDSALLDTRGYVLWRLGRFEEAFKDIDAAVEEHKPEYLASRRLIERRGTYAVDERTLSADLRRRDEGMAALYYHRALVNESLGDTDQAAKDFVRVSNLGFDPEKGVF